MEQREFQKKLNEAQRALALMAHIRFLPGFTDQPSGGDKFLASSHIDQRDLDRNAIIYAFKTELEKCKTVEEVWTLILDQLKSIFKDERYFLGSNNGIDWPQVEYQLEVTPTAKKDDGQLRVKCIRAIYNQFWS